MLAHCSCWRSESSAQEAADEPLVICSAVTVGKLLCNTTLPLYPSPYNSSLNPSFVCESPKRKEVHVHKELQSDSVIFAATHTTGQAIDPALTKSQRGV